MKKVIINLTVIRDDLGTLQISSTRHNLDTLLGYMQLCDRCIAELQKAMDQENTEGEQ